MSDLLGEHVVRVPPVRMVGLERLGDEICKELGADYSNGPVVLDWAELVEKRLARSGLLFYPATLDELPDCEGATDPAGNGPIRILIRQDVYDDLSLPGRRSNRSRATVAHEFSHAVLHVPYIRRLRSVVFGELLLKRVTRKEIPAYEDPEWQAWALAGCILAPRQSIMTMAGASAAELAEAHGVSEAFMKAHLRRLRLEVKSR